MFKGVSQKLLLNKIKVRGLCLQGGEEVRNQARDSLPSYLGFYFVTQYS
jgi:hypothetical protein